MVGQHSDETIDLKCLPFYRWANFSSGNSYLKIWVMHTLLCRILVGKVWWAQGLGIVFIIIP